MIQGGSSKPKGHVDFKSAFYFQTPIWIADAPMFLKNTIKVTDKYIKKAEKNLKDKSDPFILLKEKFDVYKKAGAVGAGKQNARITDQREIKVSYSNLSKD